MSRFSRLAIAMGLFAAPLTHSDPADFLKVVLKGKDGQRVLKKWNVDELKFWKTETLREADPESQRAAEWTGVRISHLIDVALLELSVNERAEIDLILLRAKQGNEVAIPRSLFARYPLILAYQMNQAAMGSKGPLHSIAPLTNAKLLSEGLPARLYFLPSVSEIEFTSAKRRFDRFVLSRRTNPAAIRGEKLFLKNCMTCHSPDKWSASKLQSYSSFDSLVRGPHQKVLEMPSLQPADCRGIKSYVEELLLTNPKVAAN